MRRADGVSIGVLALTLALLVFVCPAHADRTRAHVVTRDAPAPAAERVPVKRHVLTPHQIPRHASAQIVQRQVVAPAATVGRALSEQPVRPHLAEVIVGSRGIRVTDGVIEANPPVQIFVDPEQDLSHLDRGHHLRRAQIRHSHWLSRQAAKPARVIQRPGQLDAAADEPSRIQPRAIIRIPTQLRPDDEPEDAPHSIPSVPRPPRGQSAPSLVSAE